MLVCLSGGLEIFPAGKGRSCCCCCVSSVFRKRVRALLRQTETLASVGLVQDAVDGRYQQLPCHPVRRRVYPFCRTAVIVTCSIRAWGTLWSCFLHDGRTHHEQDTLTIFEIVIVGMLPLRLSHTHEYAILLEINGHKITYERVATALRCIRIVEPRRRGTRSYGNLSAASKAPIVACQFPEGLRLKPSI